MKPAPQRPAVTPNRSTLATHTWRYVVCAILLGAALAGCGSSSSDGSGSVSSSQSGGSTAQSSSLPLVSAAPAASGVVHTITWDLPNGEPTTVDPVKAGDYGPDMVASNLCDDLFRMDPRWGEHPEIAQSYRYPNPKTLVLNIRHGVTFWDGKPLTATDVTYSLERNMRPSTGAINGGFFGPVASIDQTGPSQVTIHFKSPDELFIKELATVVGAVVEKAYVEKVGDKRFGSPGAKVMCSGPYELQSWTSGQQMVLVKNPHYWDVSLRPKVGQVTIKFISDSSTLTSALSSGEIDGAYEVPPSAVPALKSSSTGKLYFGPSLGLEELAAAAKTGPAANPDVRKALSLTLDRAAVAQKIYNGAATPNLAMTPPTAWTPASARGVYAAAYRALPGAAADVAQAKKLIAGVPGASQPMVLALPAGDQTSVNLATLVQQYAAQIGLHVELKQMQPLDFSNLFYEPQTRKGIDFVLTSGFLDIPDQLDYLSYFVYPDSIFNWIGYDDHTVQNLVNEALTTFDGSKRAKLLVQAQARYMGDEVLVPMLSLDEITYLSSKLGGATTSFAYIFEPSFAYLGGK